MVSRETALVIVPCLNEACHLPTLLRGLESDPACAKIIVCDGGSTDGSRDIVLQAASAGSKVILLDNPNRLQAAGVNLAVDTYGGTHHWFARIDAHCEYPADYVSRLLASAMEADADSVVVPMVTHSNKGCFQRGVAAAQNSVLGTGGSAHRRVGQGRWVDHGHHALMRLSAFRSAGKYDENFFANEDAEFDARLTGSGGKIWLEPRAAITYYPRDAPLPLWRQYFRYGQGRAMMIRRHRPVMKLRQVAPLGVCPAVLAGLAGAAAQGNGGLLMLPAITWLLACCLYGTFLALRERAPCAAWSGPAAIVMHLAWSSGFWLRWLGLPRPLPSIERHQPRET